MLSVVVQPRPTLLLNMRSSAIVPEASSKQLRQEDTWLDTRSPTRLDAEDAHRPLDDSFVQSFKHALRSEAHQHTINYLNDETEQLLFASSPRMVQVGFLIPTQQPLLKTSRHTIL